MRESPVAEVLAGRGAWALHEGDTLELKLPPECADAWIQVPPAAIGFMGKAWDSDRGGPDAWIEWAARLFKVAFDALKPGAHGAVWALPRTADLTMQALRRAGFGIRDVKVHAFACLSEDTEILVDGRWEPYQKAGAGRLALCYDVDRDRYFWGPIEEVYVYPGYEDIAYRIRSDSTDQIVTREHRCLVERGGTYRFERAWGIAREREARVPVLEDVRNLLDALSVPNEGGGDTDPFVFAGLPAKTCPPEAETAQTVADVPVVRKALQTEEQRGARQGEVLFIPVRRQASSRAGGVLRVDAPSRSDGTGGVDGGESRELSCQDDWPEQSRLAGRRDPQTHTRELWAGEVRSLPGGAYLDGSTGRVCDGASPTRGDGDRETVDAGRDGTSRGPQSDQQRACEFEPICDQPGPQAVRGARFTRSDLARVEPVLYRGTVWCVRVPTGAFVARRNGKVFVTGNSGFPKSLDISKAIDAAAGAEREVTGTRTLTDARHWAGWGTALKPASEHWIIVRKPMPGTVATNVLAHGTGGINIDAGRVGTDWSERPESWKRSGHTADHGADKIAAPPGNGINCHPEGRWPANLVFSHAQWDESSCAACGLTMPFAASFCPACGAGVEVRRAGCRCVGERRVKGSGDFGSATKRSGGIMNVTDEPRDTAGSGYAGLDRLETVGAWECLATCDRCGQSALVSSGGDAGPCAGCGVLRRWACPVARLDEQSGERVSGSRAAGLYARTGYSGGWPGEQSETIEGNAGGASRFFHCFPPDTTEPFWFSAKPSTAEREAGLSGLPRKTGGELTGREDGGAGTQSPRAGAGRTSNGRANDHPTVKGFHLIGHLCDLLVPPGGLVLDLTAGSGTLGAVVAHRHHVTGWRAIMSELDPGYCRIIRARCQHWGARRWKPARAKPAPVAKPSAQARTLDLFARLGDPEAAE